MWRQARRSWAASADRARAFAFIAGLAVLLSGSFGCASKSMVSFRCDSYVNDGIVLTIDLIEVSEEEIGLIRQTGEEWFYSGLRRQLADRIKTVTVTGGCESTVDLTELTAKEKYLRKKKGHGTLAVIAEYQSRYEDGHMLFLRREQWKGRKVVVRVHDVFLSIAG